MFEKYIFKKFTTYLCVSFKHFFVIVNSLSPPLVLFCDIDIFSFHETNIASSTRRVLSCSIYLCGDAKRCFCVSPLFMKYRFSYIHTPLKEYIQLNFALIFLYKLDGVFKINVHSSLFTSSEFANNFEIFQLNLSHAEMKL